MKTARALVLVLAVCAGSALSAETVRLTMYDDGLACPGGCDAHVVFHSSMNGTEFAHAPATPNAPFAACTNGQPCAVCLESGGLQCLEAVYRGSGPPPMTFDFTPRFYEQACAANPIEPVLAQKCAELERAAATLRGRINCILEPRRAACATMMSAAIAARDMDRVEFERCIAAGERNYNATVPIERRRSLNCAYEQQGTGGPNSRGVTWKRLLPGACRDGTFAGRDGLDCCSGSLLADGPLGRECRSFYPASED